MVQTGVCLISRGNKERIVVAEIGLQELIYQIKQELLRTNQAAQARDPYPLFVVDKIELEIAVKVSRVRNNEIAITVLDTANLRSGETQTHEHGHVVKITLTPLLSRDEMVSDIMRDPRAHSTIRNDLQKALMRGGEAPAGEAE